MKLSDLFLYGCVASSVSLVGVGLIESLKPDNRVSEVRKQREETAKHINKRG